MKDGVMKVWIVFCLLLLVLFTMLLNNNKVLTEPEKRFTTSKILVLKGENISLSAGSCSPFVWQNTVTGEIISGVPQKSSPIGTVCKNYYITENIKVSSGTWDNITGSAEFLVESDQEIQITLIETSVGKIGNGLISLLVVLIIWLLGMMAIDSLVI